MIITYLLGAGASYQALPTVNKIPESLEEVISKISAITLPAADKYTKIQPKAISANQYKEFLADDLKWLSEASKHHASIDTFAKKLYLNGQQSELLKLKNALSAYFALLQAIKLTDKRYDSFYASILSKHMLDFPSNIRILSWNYDTQLEKSYKQFSKNAQDVFVASKFQRYTLDKGFNIFKINGTAAFRHMQYNDNYYYCDLAKEFNADSLDQVVFSYSRCRQLSDSYYSALSFAWEHDGFIDNIIPHIEDTQILVVIGYSFPFLTGQLTENYWQTSH